LESWENIINTNILPKFYRQIESTLGDNYPTFNMVLNSKITFVKEIFNIFREKIKHNKYISTMQGDLFDISIFNILNKPNGFEMLYDYIIQNTKNVNNMVYTDDMIFIPLHIMVPIFQKPLSNKFVKFPYFLKYKKIEGKYLTIFNKDTFNDFLDLINDIDIQIKDWLNLNSRENDIIMDNYLKYMELFMPDFQLQSFINTNIIIYVKRKNVSNWVIEVPWEGFIDIWTEYSSKYKTLTSQTIYEGKLPTGDIPCIVEKRQIEVNNNINKGYIKIPTVFWELRDQLGMLILRLRRERVVEYTDDTAIFREFSDNPLKYCKKIKAILLGLKTLINTIKQNLLEEKINPQIKKDENYKNFIEKCKDVSRFDYIECGADGFVSYLLKQQNIEYWKRLGYIDEKEKTKREKRSTYPIDFIDDESKILYSEQLRNKNLPYLRKRSLDDFKQTLSKKPK